jgi:hypothetical protein
MVREQISSVRDMIALRRRDAKPDEVRPQRDTRHRHQRLLRALDGDRRVKRSFG